VGTPAYLAPEQFRGNRDAVDRRTDVYALGVTLYECLTLRRPFEAEMFQELFQKILNEVPVDPRKVNPRIPLDLRTVIETAMERDQLRRYPTALEFAEDLRRVRIFEPIHAKPASVGVRAQKWLRRNPAQGVAIGSTSLFVIAVGSFLIGNAVSMRRTVRAELASAEAALGAGQFDAANDALARADARDSAFARSCGIDALRAKIERAQFLSSQNAKKTDDYAKAAAARQESGVAQEKHAQIAANIAALRTSVSTERPNIFAKYSPPESRAAYATRELELATREAEAKRLLQESEEALQRAARFEAPWGAMTPETEAAFAAFYYMQWTAAENSNNSMQAAWLRSQVERFDTTHKYRDEMLGRGTLAFAASPPDADLYLYRYVPYESLSEGGAVPRLVPAPTTGVGILPDPKRNCGFQAGSLAWVIQSVDAGSPAAAARLEPGDLVVSIQGNNCGDGLFVAEGSSTLANLGIEPLMRLASVNGARVDGEFDLAHAPKSQIDGSDLIGIAARKDPIQVAKTAVRWVSADAILQSNAPAEMQVHCVRSGECVDVTVPRGARMGITCRRTAYPLVRAKVNQIRAGAPIAIDPGSYLVLARHRSREDQLVPVNVPRSSKIAIGVELLAKASAPPGFVAIPATPFIYQGDASAFDPRPAITKNTPAYFMASKEVTNDEWFAFVNDPASLQKIQEKGRRVYVPRESSKLLARENGSGGFTWQRGSGRTPVYGISWNDVNDYVAWRNKKATQDNEPWEYDLPTQEEWEKAARGADGREFPWGSRFDFSLTVGQHHKSDWLLDEAGGFEPRDESPFGICDMAGSRREFTKDRVPNMDPPAYYTRGAFWGEQGEIAFRAASRAFVNGEYAGGNIGFRLVARRRQ
jgi:formylglycine-generating enzyme required for sulfatase activity